MISCPKALMGYAPMEGELLGDALEAAFRQTESLLPRFSHGYKYSHSVNGFYDPPTANVEWTTGFWTGELWLCHELSGRDVFRKAAEWQCRDFADRIDSMIDVEHHDMGFLYSPSCVASWMLTGDKASRDAALKAAGNLVSRFQQKGRFIQAWGPMGEEGNYRLIIDCLLNLPLLFWAAGETGDATFERTARAHLDTALGLVLRPDGSTYHTYFFDPETGKPTRGVTAQGRRDGSAWARGQAWGIYGTAIARRYIDDGRSGEVFGKVTEYFLDHLPADGIPYWDFDFDIPSKEPRDSSALAIAACGLLEASRSAGEEESALLRSIASRMATALYVNCAVKDPSVSNGQLLHGTYARSTPTNSCRDRGVDECNPWGDYYYVELLARLKKDWTPYW